ETPRSRVCGGTLPPGRRLVAGWGGVIVWAILLAHAAQAQYVERRSLNTSGGVTFTGNTLGLSKETSANAPGTDDSIGTFITVDMSQQDGTYPPATTTDRAAPP